MLSGKSTFFGVFSKVLEFLLVAFKLQEIHWAAFFFRCFTLRFQEKTYADSEILQLNSTSTYILHTPDLLTSRAQRT